MMPSPTKEILRTMGNLRKNLDDINARIHSRRIRGVDAMETAHDRRRYATRSVTAMRAAMGNPKDPENEDMDMDMDIRPRHNMAMLYRRRQLWYDDPELRKWFRATVGTVGKEQEEGEEEEDQVGGDEEEDQAGDEEE